MKNLSVIWLSSLLLIYLFSCNDSPTNSPFSVIEDAGLYYAGDVGSKFFYSIDTLKSDGDYEHIGSRETLFENIQIYDSVLYTVQKNSNLIGPEISEDRILFRSSNRGVYFAADTNLIGDLLSDPILRPIRDRIKFDTEANIFSTPIFDNRYWKVFKMNYELGNSFELTLFEIVSSFIGVDSLLISQRNEMVESEKLNYRLRVINPLDSLSVQEYFAEGWFTKNIGLVKLQGNAFIINLLTGSGITVPDTTRIIRQTLLDYSIVR